MDDRSTDVIVTDAWALSAPALLYEYYLLVISACSLNCEYHLRLDDHRMDVIYARLLSRNFPFMNR